MTNNKRILFLAPHTDDVELGCGGTIARLMEEGSDVYVAVFSTARASLPPGADPDMLRNEFKKAMDVLEISNEQIFIYDYQVRKLNYSRQEVLEELVKLRSQIDPEMVFLPSGSDLHQDHQVLHAEGLRAFKDITVWGYELPWNHITFPAQAFIILKDKHLQAKWDALKVYESQIQKGRNYFTYDFIQGLAKVRGVQVRAEYAEAFQVMRIKL